MVLVQCAVSVHRYNSNSACPIACDPNPPPHDRPAATIPQTATVIRERFSSSFLFVLTAGCTVIGLHNFWHFPVYAAHNGGGAFVAVYALTAFVLGVPLLSAQLMIGRSTRRTPEAAVASLAAQRNATRWWGIAGAAAMLTGFALLPVTSVVGGWMLGYLPRAISGSLNGADLQTANALFSSLAWDPERQLFWHGVFMWCLLLALGRPLHRGIELAIKIVAPVFFLLLFAELWYSHRHGDWAQAVASIFSFDFAALGLRGFWLAVGQAFFSLGLGTAALMMYGAYLPTRASARAVAFWVVTMDVVVSVAGAFIVLPIVYLAGSDPGAGPSLIAQSAAVGYNTLAYGPVARTLLFVLLFLAAWMSALGLAEPIVSWLEARRVGRLKSAVIVVGVAWLLGVGVALSFNYWRFSFVFEGLLKTLGAVDIVQIAVAGIGMPLVGFLIAIFTGWVMPHEAMFAGGGRISHIGFHVWRWLLRVLVPVWCMAVLMNMRLFL